MENRELAIDTTALKRDADALRTNLRSIESEVDGLFNALAVLNRSWTGPANEALSLQFRKDCESMKELCGVVGKLLACMQDAAVRYEKGENEAENVIDAIRI